MVPDHHEGGLSRNVYFREEQEWLRAIAAAVREGLTFEAFPPDMSRSGYYQIEFTGGY